MDYEEAGCDADERAEQLEEMKDGIVTDTIHDEALFCGEDTYGRHYYADKWAKIEDEHYPQCPMSIAAREKRISTLCACAILEKGYKNEAGEGE